MMDGSSKPSATVVMAHFALACANAILGLGTVVSKMGLDSFNPVIFALLRELIAAPLLFLMSHMIEKKATAFDYAAIAPAVAAAPQNSHTDELSSRCPQLQWIDVLQFSVAGSMLFGTNLFYLVGIKMLGATSAAVWQSSLPIFTMLMAVLVGYERLSLLKVLGVLCAFAGCAFITMYSPDAADSNAGAGGSQLAGNAVFLLQVSACAGFFVAEKPLLRRWSPLATLAYSYAIASVLMLAAALIVTSSPALLGVMCPDCPPGGGWAVPAKAWFAIAYWVVLGSICGYFLLTWGNLHVDATIVGVYFTVQPLAAVLAAMVVITLTPPPHYHLAGPGVSDLGALGIFVGVGLLIRDARLGHEGSSPQHGVCGVLSGENGAPLQQEEQRWPIGASVSHDNVLLAVRLRQSVQIRAGTTRSTDSLPRVARALNAPPDPEPSDYRPPGRAGLSHES